MLWGLNAANDKPSENQESQELSNDAFKSRHGSGAFFLYESSDNIDCKAKRTTLPDWTGLIWDRGDRRGFWDSLAPAAAEAMAQGGNETRQLNKPPHTENAAEHKKPPWDKSINLQQGDALSRLSGGEEKMWDGSRVQLGIFGVQTNTKPNI